MGRTPTDSDLPAKVAELEDAIRARDEVIATIGHELRNPLSPVYLQLAHLIQVVESAGEPVATEWLLPRLTGMHARLVRLLETLDRLLEASHRGGDIALQPERIDLVEVVREVTSGMQTQLEAARSDLTIEAPQPVVGSWDRVRVEQIAVNLLANAVRYGAGKPIQVRIVPAGTTAEIEVRDHGVGIADEDQERIFAQYERVAGQPSTGGFGLGLWIVKRLCNAMGGDVAVRSRPGEGAAFTVTLPRAESETG